MVSKVNVKKQIHIICFDLYLVTMVVQTFVYGTENRWCVDLTTHVSIGVFWMTEGRR